MNANLSLDAILDGLEPTLTAWRRDLHAHPETAFEEHRTAAFVAEKLTEFGLDVVTGIAKTGVVATLRCGSGNKAFGFRADMDALPLQEENTFSYRSRHAGKMHACGHDGHTTMLLGAAKILAESRTFDGTLHFIFQPAEENEGGARVMLEERLLERFPMQAVFGMHNLPGLPIGEFAINKGSYMASCNCFELEIIGKGAHAALPEQGVDPIVIGSQIVQAYQSLLTRMKSAQKPAVVSITQFNAGNALNVCPATATIKGSCRSFDADLDFWIEKQLAGIANSLCAAFGAECRFSYRKQYPVLKNHDEPTAIAVEVAKSLVGEHGVNAAFPPVMGSEDFAFFLERLPGSYIFIGNGLHDAEATTACMLHNPGYDFNDKILTMGAKYWLALAHRLFES
ncbi:M20 aminoacylase family protein [Emcibacter nanhaiensis]|uniref:Amidohydrolase n=1 Tax=Emcibacter nanhaiensis TaxID=1505037 RepID=A0A501PG72_9PROT|nr:M20 aminoacylase family protein [Emcibacter nanhaiensis]TPD59002.1 amidohydrolase [Emcibacter nanhaiensis]